MWWLIEEMWLLIWRCGGFIKAMRWLAHCGDVVAHLAMWWNHPRDVVALWYRIRLLWQRFRVRIRHLTQ